MRNVPTKPKEICPAVQPLLIVLWLCCAPLVISGLLSDALEISALGIIFALGITCTTLPFMYPRILASKEGLYIQRKRKEPLEMLPWSQFQCAYTFRQGITYKACGILFTTRPMTKQEQLAAAKACQEGGFRPRLIFEGNVWVGTSSATMQTLGVTIPDHIQQMPEIACANVNLRFTKRI